MTEISLFGAFLAGLLSFLSPCVLPLVPAYLSYISGESVDTLRTHNPKLHLRAMMQAAWFVCGFSLIFIAMGASATLIGQWLLAHMSMLAKLAGVLIVIFGIHYLGWIRIPWLMADAHLDVTHIKAARSIGALLLGAAFAFGWTPCVGPILGTILALAGAQSHVTEGVALLTMYSLGLALPFLVAAAATDHFIRWMKRFRSRLRIVEIVSGCLLIFVGILIFTSSFSLVSSWLLQVFPFLSDIERQLPL